MSPYTTIGVVACLIVLWMAPSLAAQPSVDRELRSLENRISRLESEVRALNSDVRSVRSIAEDASGLGVALFLFGAFCALWAQNTDRNAWLWFFLGLLFSVITVLVLLYKNANPNDPGKAPMPNLLR